MFFWDIAGTITAAVSQFYYILGLVFLWRGWKNAYLRQAMKTYEWLVEFRL